MDAGRLSICGEVSSGLDLHHIRGQDSLWAVIAWLNIIAAANKESKSDKVIGINEILQDHYKKYGRSVFSRYDYEEVSSTSAQQLVDALNKHIADGSLLKTKCESSMGLFVVSKTWNFDYTDPMEEPGVNHLVRGWQMDCFQVEWDREPGSPREPR